MASSSDPTFSGGELTPAQLMKQAAEQQAQHFHVPTVEDVPDEDSTAAVPAPVEAAAPTSNGSTGYAMSAKAAGKQPAQASPGASQPPPKPAAPAFSVTEDAFPSLGPAAKAPTASTWGQRPASIANAARTGNVVNGTSGAATPASVNGTRQVKLPGQHVDSYAIPTRSLKSNMGKSREQVIRDVTGRSSVKIATSQIHQDNEPVLLLKASGPSEAVVREKLKTLTAELCKKESEKYAVPSAVRAQIIGKGGSKIKDLQNFSGARIQLPSAPKPGEITSLSEDDDMIEITLEGDPLAIRVAKHKIDEIIGSRPNQQQASNTTLRDFPPEFFPFLNSTQYMPELARHQSNGLNINIPHYHTWQQQPPASTARALVPREGHHIQIRGPRESAVQARADFERTVQQLQERLAIEELLGIEANRHQFILGAPGFDLDDFVRETGCSLVLPPPGDDSETIYVVGPPDRIEAAKDKAIDLASGMVNNPVDFARHYQGPSESRAQYIRNVSRYMQKRQALNEITNQHNAQITFPSDPSQPLTLWTRDPRAGVKARQDVLNTISGHPHQRFRNMNVHPFYQRNLEEQYARHLREQHGVHVIRSGEDDDEQLLLVYEDRNPVHQYNIPQRRPEAEEVARFQEALQEAEQYLLQAIGEQQAIISRQIEAPMKYREKLSRFASRQEPTSKYPVRYTGLDTPAVRGANFPIAVQGPMTEVDESEARLLAFIEEQIRDEAERDYTTTCTFPQHLQGRLVGKEGAMIKKLSEDFDVRVDTTKDSNEVTIKGPPAKAEAAKAHIISMAKQAEDETTIHLTIEPQFHAELIGKGGSGISRYQQKYGVQILFPKSGSGEADGRRVAQGPNQVVVKGSKRSVESAKDDLWDLYSALKSQSYSAVVSVAPASIPSLIGSKGSEADAIRAETGTRIDFPNASDPVDASGRQEIKIRGSKEGVEQARKAIEAKSRVLDNTITETLSVQRKYYTPLIGSRGENLKQLITAAGGDPTQSARIVQIPKPSSAEEVIRLVGSSDVVTQLMQSINDFVAVRESQVTDTIEVPADRHGALIGAGGAVKKSIQSECNVVLDIPDRTVTGPARAQVKVIGQPADIEKAKERINTILRQGAGETVHVPTRLHHTMSDGGKLFQILRRDMNVTVDHNRQRAPARPAAPTFQQDVSSMPLITDDSAGALSAPDVFDTAKWHIMDNEVPADGNDPTIPWVLKGNSDDVEKARMIVEAAIVAAGKSATGYLVLPDPSSTHSHVVGPGGSTIKAIRETTGVNPTVPKAGEGGPIVVVGTPEKLEAAREMILQAVVDGMNRGPRSRGGPRSPR